MKLEGERQQAEDLETKYSALFSPVWVWGFFFMSGLFFFLSGKVAPLVNQLPRSSNGFWCLGGQPRI